MKLIETRFCSECGGTEFREESNNLYSCRCCGQEMCIDSDYTQVIMKNLEHWYNGDIHPRRENKSGIDLIAKERARQIDEEGFKVKADVENYPGTELSRAAACYAMPDGCRGLICTIESDPDYKPSQPYMDILWPWTDTFWKPSPQDRIRELEKAGALIAAEIDRLQFLSKSRKREVEHGI